MINFIGFPTVGKTFLYKISYYFISFGIDLDLLIYCCYSFNPSLIFNINYNERIFRILEYFIYFLLYYKIYCLGGGSIIYFGIFLSIICFNYFNNILIYRELNLSIRNIFNSIVVNDFIMDRKYNYNFSYNILIYNNE